MESVSYIPSEQAMRGEQHQSPTTTLLGPDSLACPEGFLLGDVAPLTPTLCSFATLANQTIALRPAPTLRLGLSGNVAHLESVPAMV